MGHEDFDGERAVRVLGHPVRIRILELLAQKGPLSWKELSKEVGTSTGALYHHIDVLERMVEQDSSKRYALTKLGLAVHAYLEAHSSPRDASGLNRLVKRRSPASFVRDTLVPRPLLQLLTSSPPRAAASLAGVSAGVLLTVSLSGSQVLLLSFSPSPGLLQTLESFGGSLLALTGLGYAGARAARARVDSLVLLASTAIAFVPLAAFSLLLHALVSRDSLWVFADRNVLTLVFAMFQGWSAIIAGAGLSVASGLRVEKALPVSLILLYVTIMVMFVQGLRFI